MNIRAFSITQASAIAALAWVCGQLAAFLPAFAAYQQVAISAGSLVIAAAFMVVNALHHRTNIVGTMGAPALTAAHSQIAAQGNAASVLRNQVQSAGMEPVA